MNTLRTTVLAASVTVLMCLGACADMNRQQKDTAIGAGVGAVAGAVLTGGSPLGTGAGAVVGGVIGSETHK